MKGVELGGYVELEPLVVRELNFDEFGEVVGEILDDNIDGVVVDESVLRVEELGDRVGED